MERFDKANEARRHARNTAQKPGATRKIEDKRDKPPKHKKDELEYRALWTREPIGGMEA